MDIKANLDTVKRQIAEAAQAAKRHPDEIKLIAVSKTKPVADIQAAVAAGQVDLGENRARELQEKQPQISGARWHMIGHLQRNKVKYIAPFVDLIHSVDSARLLEEINRQAEKNERVIDCLLQMHISEEEQKYGLDLDEARQILQNIEQYPHVRILGLMGMAALTDDRETIRRQFIQLRQWRDELKKTTHDRIDLSELSMGMSGDYDLAIAEGATMVRIGTAIFGPR